MSHVMVDIESLGIKPGSVICTIGAVEFDPYSLSPLGAEFHEAIELQSSIHRGLTMDAGTVLWWLQQSDDARAALVEKLRGGSCLSTVLGALAIFLSPLDPKEQVTCWSCGSFDFELLAAAYAAVGLKAPWHYRVRDFRTLRDEFGSPEDMPPPGVSHDALSDAKWQAQYLQNMFARLRGNHVANAGVQPRIGSRLGPVTLSSDEDHRTHAAP